MNLRFFYIFPLDSTVLRWFLKITVSHDLQTIFSLEENLDHRWITGILANTSIYYNPFYNKSPHCYYIKQLFENFGRTYMLD